MGLRGISMHRTRVLLAALLVAGSSHIAFAQTTTTPPGTTDAKPSDGGPLIYLNADGRLDMAVAAVKANGGSVVQAKHSIGSAGSRAIICHGRSIFTSSK